MYGPISLAPVDGWWPVVQLDIGERLYPFGSYRCLSTSIVLAGPRPTGPVVGRIVAVVRPSVELPAAVFGVEVAEQSPLPEIGHAAKGLHLSLAPLKTGHQNRHEHCDDGNGHERFDVCKGPCCRAPTRKHGLGVHNIPLQNTPPL